MEGLTVLGNLISDIIYVLFQRKKRNTLIPLGNSVPPLLLK